MLVLLLGTVPSLIKPEISYLVLGLLGGLILSLIVFSPFWISWHYSVYIVTDQRLLQIKQKGLWSRSVVDISLNQIQMVNYQVSGLQETMLGFGTIMMQTFVGDLIIHDVHQPAQIQKKILKILRDKGIINVKPPQVPAQEENEGK